jgi:hypothetical protein
VRWNPDDADSIAAGINKFIGGRRFTGSTRFDVLQPLLNQLARNSPRLTVLIFCDGDGSIQGTPYDYGINQAFQKRQAEQKQKRQPFVIILRAQSGKYVGCTANFPPPGVLNFPPFPPLPAPPPPAHTNAPPPPAHTNVPPPPPPKVEQPLMIIGTNLVTSWPANPVPAPPAKEPAVIQANAVNAPPAGIPLNPPPVTVVPSSPAPVQTNSVPTMPPNNTPPVVPAMPAHSNPLAANSVLTNAMERPENSGSSRRNLLVIGAGLLVAAVALGAFALTRSRRADRDSLITRAMRKHR